MTLCDRAKSQLSRKIETWELLSKKQRRISYADYSFDRYDRVPQARLLRGSASTLRPISCPLAMEPSARHANTGHTSNC
jgi:hypothetical protein